MTEWAFVKLLGGVRGTLFALLAVCALAWGGTQTLRLHLKQDTLDRIAAQAAHSAVVVSEKNREIEQERSDEVNRLTIAYEQGKAAGEKRNQGVVDDVRTGKYVLRNTLRCPANPAAAAAAHSGAVADAAAEAGVLSRDDVLFLVRFAGDADGLRDKLALCEANLRADRGLAP
jgi:hypothetical protein